MRLTSAKHKQYQAFPPDRRHRGNQSNVEEKRETLETYVIEATKLTTFSKSFFANRLKPFLNKSYTEPGASEAGVRRGNCPPCLLLFLKRGGRGGRLCSLKLVLQINFLLCSINLCNLDHH